MHGGGWAVADPETDDEFCSFMTQTFDIIVVSVDYRKLPSWKFPYGVSDVAAIADAVIRDESLNVDKTKVALGGFSAGGNLAFAASQMESHKGHVSSLVGLFPCLDLTESLQKKLNRRSEEAWTDILESSANFLDWASFLMVLTGEIHSFRRDGRGGRTCLDISILPVQNTICSVMRQIRWRSPWRSLGSRELVFSRCQPEDGWKQGSIIWECARGRFHAFTHVTEWGQKERDRVKAVEEMYLRVGEWLKDGIWVSQSRVGPPNHCSPQSEIVLEHFGIDLARAGERVAKWSSRETD